MPIEMTSLTAPDQINPLLMSFSEETERELTSLLKVKGAAITIGEELINQARWDELYRLLQRLLMRGRICTELLTRAVNELNDNWRFAEALLGLYHDQEQWEEWFSLLLYAPKNTRGPIKSLRRLS